MPPTPTGDGPGGRTGPPPPAEDRAAPPAHRAPRPGGGGHGGEQDPLDGLGAPPGWHPLATSAGTFRLRPVVLPADLTLVTGWMNDPEVAAFWELDGPPAVTARHLGRQLHDGDGHSVPCLGLLDDTPVSYWEVYRADLDPLARHYPARPHDTGVHLLIAGAARRGRGLGSLLLRTVTTLILRHRPTCSRVVAEPDVRNRASVAAFCRAGFRIAAEVALPDKRAALMIRERPPAHPHDSAP
ncbi:GNAT family N-acetyltransferase [Streptomyces sp. LE64]|uniref:GNAT family N-acetyltransferase n=1 Tax=Streptomyces sp. LE64 TaxID=3448653 RepID=UPI00404165F4